MNRDQQTLGSTERADHGVIGSTETADQGVIGSTETADQGVIGSTSTETADQGVIGSTEMADQGVMGSMEMADHDARELDQHGDVNEESKAPPGSHKQQDCMLYTVIHKAADALCSNTYFRNNLYTSMAYGNSTKCLTNEKCSRSEARTTTDSLVEFINNLHFPDSKKQQKKMAGDKNEGCAQNDEVAHTQRQQNCDVKDYRLSDCSTLSKHLSDQRLICGTDTNQTVQGPATSCPSGDIEPATTRPSVTSRPSDDMENYFRINAHLLDNDTDSSMFRETGNTCSYAEKCSSGTVPNSTVGNLAVVNGSKSTYAKDEIPISDENYIACSTSTLGNTSIDSEGCSCNIGDTVECLSNDEGCDSCRRFSHELDVVLLDGGRNSPNDLDVEQPSRGSRGSHRNVQDSRGSHHNVNDSQGSSRNMNDSRGSHRNVQNAWLDFTGDNLQEQMCDLGFEDEFPDIVSRYQNVDTSQNSDSGDEHEDFIEVDISKPFYADFDSTSCGSHSMQSSSSNDELCLTAAVGVPGATSTTAIHYSHSEDTPEKTSPGAQSSTVGCNTDEVCECGDSELVERPRRLSVLGEPVLGEPFLGGSALGEPVLGGSVLGGSILDGSALGRSALGGSVLGGSALGGSALGGSVLNGSALGGFVLGGSALGESVLGGSVLGGASGTCNVSSTRSDSTSHSESSYLTLSSSSSIHSPFCVDCDNLFGVATSSSSIYTPPGSENPAREGETEQYELDDTLMDHDQAARHVGHMFPDQHNLKSRETVNTERRYCQCLKPDGVAMKGTVHSQQTQAPQQFVRSFSADAISSAITSHSLAGTAGAVLRGEAGRTATNNLNVDRQNTCNHDREDMFNVSRQTSTSSCDQDENNIQQQEDRASRRRRCPHFKDSVTDPLPMGVYEDCSAGEQRRSVSAQGSAVDQHKQNTLTRGSECTSSKENDTELRGCVYCNVHWPDPDFRHHARSRMRERCRDTDVTFSGSIVAARSGVDDTRRLSLDELDVPKLQVFYCDQVMTNGHQRHIKSGCDEEIENNLQNDEWAKECATDRVSTSANIHPEHKDLEGHEGQALVFTKFIQDYCRTQLQAMHDLRVIEPSCSQPKCSTSAYHSGGATTRQGDDLSCVMIWSEYDARQLQVEQVGTSACGATAAINVLKAFEIHVNKSRVCEAIHTNLRAEKAALPEYLLSRSIAGCTALDIIQGIESLTEGYIRGVFFHFYPARDISLLEWLAQWMRKGAVPLLTLNLQKAVPLGYPIPDAWHHQMVYGVDQKGVYLTNPLNVVAEADIQQQLCSDSVLLVRRNDVISHWTDSCDLTVLIRQRDPRWRTMNVLGQVVNVLREDRMSLVTGFRPQLTTHVQIPAWYSAGVTLFTRRDSDAHCQLRTTSSELPLVQPPDQ